MSQNQPESFKAQILVVDDSAVNLTFVCTMLAEFGYVAQGVRTAAEAWAAANRESPDLILLDINLPDGNGYDVCRQLKANPMSEDIPVIFLSGMEGTLDKVKAFELGGVDYITKPFEIEEVLARIENHLTIKRLQAALQQANDDLETQVATRTSQLSDTVAELKEQVAERKQAEAALQQHAERLRLINQIDQAILAVQSPVEIAQAALHHLKHLIPCQRASLTIFDFKANEVSIRVLDPGDNTELAVGSRMSLDDFGGLGDLQQGLPYVVQDISAHYAKSSIHNQLLVEGIRSLINVPLIVQDSLIGSLNLGTTEPDVFTVEHLAIAREVAAPLAVAISQAHLYEAEAQRRQEAEALSDIAAALNSTLSLENVLLRILDNIDRIVDYDAAHIMMIDSGLARIVSQQGYSTYRAPENIVAESFVIADFPFLDRIIKTRQPHIISDTSTSPDWVDREDIQWVHSYIGVPICKQDEVIGIINLGNFIPDTFTEDIAERLRALADQAAVALGNAHLHEALQRRMQLLQETQAQLVHSEMMSALGRLVASIAHEINNPMQAVALVQLNGIDLTMSEKNVIIA